MEAMAGREDCRRAENPHTPDSVLPPSRTPHRMPPGPRCGFRALAAALRVISRLVRSMRASANSGRCPCASRNQVLDWRDWLLFRDAHGIGGNHFSRGQHRIAQVAGDCVLDEQLLQLQLRSARAAGPDCGPTLRSPPSSLPWERWRRSLTCSRSSESVFSANSRDRSFTFTSS